jgi:thiosulfate dehydrogenase
MDKHDYQKQLNIIVRRVSVFCSLLIITVIVLCVGFYGEFKFKTESNAIEDTSFELFTINNYIDALDNSEENMQVKYGFELFKSTPKYIGPNNGKAELVYAGNNLSCNNCHLYAGTKPYSGALIGVVKRFPQFRGRENKMGTIEERINGCFERSMNGKVLPPDGKEMKAFVSYLSWLDRFAEPDGSFEGKGFMTIEIPERAVDLEKGKAVFNTVCYACHGTDGQGVKLKNSHVYQYPPLWGEDSFNNGAGMNRVITAANFIIGNMPYGATFENPILTDEEAYDVAGYINQQLRPQKSNPEKDFPDLKRKPVSTPYPPFADEFSIEQHQLGPFQPIMEYYMLTYGIKKVK